MKFPTNPKFVFSAALQFVIAGTFMRIGLGGLTTFDYTQTDVSSGSGTIAAPAPITIAGGVIVTWTDTQMPQAIVRDPTGAGSAGGAVGGFDSMVGANGDTGLDVALFWDADGDIFSSKEFVTVTIVGNGSDGEIYHLPVDLVFFGDNVLPDEHIPGWGGQRLPMEY